MHLLVGLGNPNPNNTNNRHNVGFLAIDSVNTKYKLSKQKPKFKGLLTTGNIDEKKIYAIKPLTFMNNSGTAIKELIDYFKIDAKGWGTSYEIVGRYLKDNNSIRARSMTEVPSKFFQSTMHVRARWRKTSQRSCHSL